MDQIELIKTVKNLFDSDNINKKDKRAVERELLDIEKGYEVHGSTLKWLQSLANRQGSLFVSAEVSQK